MKKTYKGPTNSADLELATGYEYCGDLSYTLLTKSMTEWDEDWFSISKIKVKEGSADSFTLQLLNEIYDPKFTKTTYIDFYL